ncbi:methionyl-tRNA formyltransferase [Candidatus Kinetoplastidibacterium crithidiae]|uniref:Methionyl-tRNA formyltransferase n=1 Tax=Candidatus Kinetoplastidibacterium crithidiae TCC036E TaxID=1208918 RepID=M1L5K9_9PROT|nr:methionyl-tRNA formyltransferase [Candidatus Kinetoplastibacterium crithidii]AFZ82921.1 methionyl-tRNA formyltransferase [Candidatus Kinetoplastibacterium crithidii (ex Angomonas deanei ATCC 30255)]AGF47923.1 methionyl-tRNA formyltransferase [Candidatus Kinetoplastibacterium crithidii TCC036E]
MRIIFAGTSDFARFHLAHLLSLGYDITSVFTQPDRPSGRGMHLSSSPVKKLALEAGLKVFQPSNLNQECLSDDIRDFLTKEVPDIVIVVAYGLILPSWLLKLPKLGCINVHASLLPRWRGAAPIQRAIEYGDKYSGITIIKMDSGLDTGCILLQSIVPISDDFCSKDLEARLASEGVNSLVHVIKNINELPVNPQSEDGVSYAKKIEKSESILNFSNDALSLERKIRAFNPFPGVIIRLPSFDKPIKVWQALAINSSFEGPSGVITDISVNQGIDISTGKGILRLKEVQKSGCNKCSASDFIRGHKDRLLLGMKVIDFEYSK